MLKKVWTDSVWSKVIASTIIGLSLIIYTKIESISEEITFSESLKKILDIRISVVYVVGIILVFFILKSIIKKIYETKKSYYDKKQRKLREFNKMTNIGMGVLYKWNVYFKHNGTPFIADLTVFCTKHGDAPLKLVNSNCPMRDCDNNGINVDEYLTKNHIESLVLYDWDKINK